jgi:hypothetical protein
MIDALIGIEWEPQLTLLEFPNQVITVIKKSNLDHWGHLKTGVILSVTRDSSLMVYNFQILEDGPSSVFVTIDDSYDPSYYGGCSIPKYLGVDDSMSNLEIRTRPVKLELLKDHLDFCTEYLGHFVEDLSLLTKGIGVFLPTAIGQALSQTHSSPNKHVNISFPINPGYMKYFKEASNSLWSWFSEQVTIIDYNKLSNFRTHVNGKPSDTQDYCRLHIMVPYNFNDYDGLVEKAYGIWSAESDNLLKDNIMDLAKYLDSWYSMNVQKKPILVCHTTGSKVKTVNSLF